MYIKNVKNTLLVIACVFMQQLNSLRCNAQGSLDSISQKCINVALGKTNAALQIGDMLPNICVNIAGSDNDRNFIRNLSKGKILILDFWSQWCGSCIATFPHLEKLQEKYAGQILILPVTFQSKISVNNFRKKRVRLNKPMVLPTIVEDSLLRAFFPHNGDPFEVWIDSFGKVRGTTSQFEMNESVINQVLNDDWHLVESPKSKNNDNMLVANNLAEPLFVSFLKRYDLHFPEGRNVPVIENGQKVLRCKNAPINWLLQWSLRYKYPSFYFNKKRCLYLFKDSNTLKKFFNDPDSIINYSYVINNRYCYELKVPNTLSDKQIFNIAYTDLEHFFNISVRMDNKLVKCLKLVRISKQDKLAGDKIIPIEFSHEPDEDLFDYIKCSGSYMGDMISALNNIKEIPLIVVDSTNYTGKINVSFRIRKNAGLDAIQLMLKKYDLRLETDFKYMNILVFEDLK